MKPSVLAAALALATLPGVTIASDTELVDSLSELEPYLGTWQIEATWSSGATLWAQADYRSLLGGQFIEGRVHVRDNGGELYQRYRTIFTPGSDPGAVDLYTFHRDGRLARSNLRVNGAVSTTEWRAGDVLIHERMELEDDSTMRWQVSQVAADQQRTALLDGRWHKVDAQALPADTGHDLGENLEPLRPWLGGWEVIDEWFDGTSLWSRTVYEQGLAGQFIEAATWTTDSDGTSYQRYASVFVGPITTTSGQVVGFSSDGTVSVAGVRIGLTPDGHPKVSTEGSAKDGRTLSQVLEMDSDRSYRWIVRLTTEDDEEPQELIDARWLRQGAVESATREVIDPLRFAASGNQLRSFTKEIVINAPLNSVWSAWTSAEAWEKLWGPPSRARFELAIGGRYEWLFDGHIGGNGSQILSYIPNRMLSFSWNSPPAQTTRLESTWVVVETEAVDEKSTRVRLTHLGFGEGSEWDVTYSYFEVAWDRVLSLMADSLAG